MFDFNKKSEKREEEIRKNEEFIKKKSEAHFEKGDTLALIIAALTTILPFAVAVILLIWFLTSMFFRFFR